MAVPLLLFVGASCGGREHVVSPYSPASSTACFQRLGLPIRGWPVETDGHVVGFMLIVRFGEADVSLMFERSEPPVKAAVGYEGGGAVGATRDRNVVVEGASGDLELRRVVEGCLKT